MDDEGIYMCVCGLSERHRWWMGAASDANITMASIVSQLISGWRLRLEQPTRTQAAVS